MFKFTGQVAVLCWAVSIQLACVVSMMLSDFTDSYGSRERQVRKKKNSGDPFSKFDLNCFLSCVYDLRKGEKKKMFLVEKTFLSGENSFHRIIFLN